jgi:hypothetical protein
MSSRENSASYEGPEHVPDPKRGQQMLDFLQSIENSDNLKELKGVMGNFLGVLNDLHPQGLSERK